MKGIMVMRIGIIHNGLNRHQQKLYVIFIDTKNDRDNLLTRRSCFTHREPHNVFKFHHQTGQFI